MSRRSMKSVHHEPDDPDIAVAMRARREELGLSIQEMARHAEVSEQSWRNYEQGRTRVREDKQPAVWRALGWEWPNARSGPAWLDAPELLGLLDSDDEEAIRRVLENPETLDAVMRGAGGRLGLPAWDDIPSALAKGCSPLLVATLGEDAARCFALGADLYDRSLTEDLEGLAGLPRGTHLGELVENHIRQTLPELWLTRYDYEFVHQLRGLCRIMQYRLVEKGINAREPLVRSLAEALVLHDIITLGAVMAASLGRSFDVDEWEGWVNALSGPDEPAHRLVTTVMAPPPDAAEHFENWFAALDDPFIPAWPSPDSSRGGGTATVTQLRHR